MRWAGDVGRHWQNLISRAFSAPPSPPWSWSQAFFHTDRKWSSYSPKMHTATVWSTKVSSDHWECICRCPSEGTDALEKNTSANTDRIQSVICGNVCLEVRREMGPCGAHGRVSSPSHSTRQSSGSCVLSDGLAALLAAVMLSYWGTGYKEGGLEGLWFHRTKGSEDRLLINWIPKSSVIFREGKHLPSKQHLERSDRMSKNSGSQIS